jgi:hypothetical protein
LALLDWRRAGGIRGRDARMRRITIPWIRIRLQDDIGDMIVSAKRVLKSTGWRRGGEEIVLFYQDQEIQLWQQQLSAPRNLDRRDQEHLDLVERKVSIPQIPRTIQQCLLLDVLGLHMDLKRVY